MNAQTPLHQTPLAVDMDGTLLRVDVLCEGLAAAVFRQPLAVLAAFLLLLTQGIPAFKARIAQIAGLDVSRLPAREPLLAFLRQEKAKGRPIYLVTAADQGQAEQVAARFGLFDGVYGTTGGVNLKGSRKLEKLKTLFPAGFTYAGDAAADLPIWRGAAGMILAGAGRSVAERAKRGGTPLEAEFDTGGHPVRAWRKALRLHQWSKNGLIFAPLMLSGNLGDMNRLVTCVLGFLILSFAASATYLINDLEDIEHDRGHRTKYRRPLAHGDLPVIQALVAAPLMLIAALVAAILVSPPFTLGLCFYLVITLGYSFRLKRVPLLDVVVLAGLYTIRLICGTLLADVEFSPWLLTFAMFFFFSMSLAKRHVEVSSATSAPDKLLPGRGYKPSDAPLTLALGVATSAAAMLVIVQYMMADAFPSNVYRLPAFLWAAPLLLGVWICRIWLLAHRGELDDDPVAFAVKDPISLGLGAVLGVAFLLARV